MDSQPPVPRTALVDGRVSILIDLMSSPASQTAPVNGMYLRMEDQNPPLPMRPFNNGMRLRFLGTVAWLEFPRHKHTRSRRTTLALTGDDSAGALIDWRPWNPEWGCARLQDAWVADQRGLRGEAVFFWKLVKEYSEEEVEQLLQEGSVASRM